MPQLYNLNTQAFEPAWVGPMQAQDVACFRERWLPIMNTKIEELRSQGRYTREGLAEFALQDAHWEWPEKFAERTGQLEWTPYALRCGGATQGLMYVNQLRNQSRLPGQEHLYVAYVELLATAPWNRRNLVASPAYRGVGEVLLTEAIFLSQEEGFEGRVALHSLPQADGFYERCGMANLGPCATAGGLVYFEWDNERAAEWLARKG